MNEFKVGLFAIAAIASLAIMSLRITANKATFGNYIPYKAIVNDATGIYARSSIRVAGINAGRIRAVKLEGTRALIEFELIDDIMITANSVFRIKTIGFLGEKYIDIGLGDPGLDRLPPNSFVRVYEGGGIEDLAKDASEVMVDVKEIIKSVNESMSNELSENVLKEILKNVQVATDSIRKIAEKNEEKINDVIDNMNRLTYQLAKETDPDEIDSLMSNLKKTGPLMDDARVLVADLRTIIGDLKEGRGTVGKLLRDEDVVDQVSETLSGMNRLVNRINNIEAEIEVFTGANTNKGARTDFNVDLYPAPERFFRLGVVSSQYGPQLIDERQVTTIGDDGIARSETIREREKDKLKFNLQIGRRVQNWGFRAGLIESTGGIGLDYHMLNNSMMISAEAFDFARDDNMIVRLITEFRIWNIFYARFMGEDLANDDFRSLTVSAGLKFSDQDLAALIGLLSTR